MRKQHSCIYIYNVSSKQTISMCNRVDLFMFLSLKALFFSGILLDEKLLPGVLTFW